MGAPDARGLEEPRQLETEPSQAGDAMQFGQEYGRVLSDGRVIGRAEPFAKVFTSSRALKRAIGLAAWAVLEDIALDATLDERGRLVAETNVRRIAENLDLNKGTVSKHLRRLRDHGVVLQEEYRNTALGRYEVYRYVLEPSACVERFTHTPTAERPSEERPSEGPEPCPKGSDTEPRAAVSEKPVHGTAVHGETVNGSLVHTCRHVDVEEDHVHPAGAEVMSSDEAETDLAAELRELGVAGWVVDDLAERHPEQRLRDALAVAKAKQLRKPAGWLVTALRDEWDLTRSLQELRAAEERSDRQTQEEAEERQRQEAEAERQQRTEAWANAVSSAFDDNELTEAVKRITTPAAGVRRRSAPLARAQLIRWAVAVSDGSATSLRHALQAGPAPPPADRVEQELPEPPADVEGAPDLSLRIRAVLQSSTFDEEVAVNE